MNLLKMLFYSNDVFLFAMHWMQFHWNVFQWIIRPEIININSNEPSFHTYSVLVIECSGSCHNINGPLAKLCIPDVIKDINIKVLNQEPMKHNI